MDVMNNNPHQLQSLSQYSKVFRPFEWLGVLAFPFALSSNVIVIARDWNLEEMPWTVLAMTAGWVAADFASGIVHWFADTWGNANWPLVGPALIRPFREHHVLPLEITRHDYVEVNGSLQLFMLPLLGLAWLVPPPLAAGFTTLALFIAFTNQIHKWAHQPVAPRMFKWVAATGILMSQRKHARHHAGAFDNHYCITNGVCNGPLNRIRFFRHAERIITRLTGAHPRQDETVYLRMAEKNPDSLSR